MIVKLDFFSSSGKLNFITNPACLILAILIFDVHFSLAQNEHGKSNDSSQDLEVPKKIYESALGHGTHLFNGSQYVEPSRRILGHPYYLNDDWDLGQVVYEGNLYENVYLRLDCEKDELIAEVDDQYEYSIMIRLVKPKVNRFKLQNHWFINLTSADNFEKFPGDGYFDVLHDGDIKVYAKRRKNFISYATNDDILEEYRIVDKLYIVHNNIFYVVKGQKSVTALFEERKKEIKTFIADQNLVFKNQKEEFTVAVISYYESLVNQQIQ